jgi:hypothetical protein
MTRSNNNKQPNIEKNKNKKPTDLLQESTRRAISTLLDFAGLRNLFPPKNLQRIREGGKPDNTSNDLLENRP